MTGDGTFYTYHPFRRLPAAVLLDAMNLACETSDEFAGLPQGTRAQALPDPQIKSYFLTAFGRSVRASPCECSSSNQPSLAQVLHTIGGENIASKISSKSGRLTRLLKSGATNSSIVDELYLSTFSRLPTHAEKQFVTKHLSKPGDRQQLFEDLLWSLLNSTDFLFNH